MIKTILILPLLFTIGCSATPEDVQLQKDKSDYILKAYQSCMISAETLRKAISTNYSDINGIVGECRTRSIYLSNERFSKGSLRRLK